MTRPPTLAQLRNLADRAERYGGLTAAEADRLRQGLDSGSGWSTKVAALRLRLHTLHAPIVRGGQQVCAHCSHDWPCDTLAALDTTFPIKEQAA